MHKIILKTNFIDITFLFSKTSGAFMRAWFNTPEKQVAIYDQLTDVYLRLDYELTGQPDNFKTLFYNSVKQLLNNYEQK